MKNEQKTITNANEVRQNKPNVPTLRFPDFSEEWRSTPMKDVCSFAKGYGIAKENLSTEGTPCILYGELYTTYKTAIAKDIRSKTQLDPTDLFHSKANDVIIPCSGETAIDIATSVCVPYDDVLLGGDLTVIRTKLNGAFLSNQLNGVRRKKIATIAQGASIVHLHADELKKINIKYPTREEQDKIAHFIDCLDERIATQNKIIEDLKILKKELCNRYFKAVHENESLKYVTLSSVLTERKEYCEKDGTYTHGTLSKEGVAPKSERYDRDFLVKKEDKQYKVTHYNDICYNPANLKFGVICRNTYGDLIFSPIYVTFEISNSVYPAYMELFLTNANFIGRIRRYEQGTVYERMAVSSEDFLSYETRMPAYEEQVKFADKIQRIHEKIELESAILDKYQSQRKYLLNAMFI